MYWYFIPIYGWILHCVDILHTVYPFFKWWTFDLFSLFGYYNNVTRTFMYRFLCGGVLSFFVSIRLRVELLGHMVTLSLIIWGTARLFSQVRAPFYIPNGKWMRVQISQHSGRYLLVSIFFFFSFYWGIIDLQCCVSFRCTAKWICYTDTYIHSFLDSLPI